MNGHDMPAEAPNQYGVGQPCSECRRPLSRYNPYVVCGPCRVRAVGQITADEVNTEIAESNADSKHSFAWERFPTRVPVRRGPLMGETGDSRELAS